MSADGQEQITVHLPVSTIEEGEIVTKHIPVVCTKAAYDYAMWAIMQGWLGDADGEGGRE